jgi:hypothetical protein
MAYCPPAVPLKIPLIEKVPSAVLNYGFDLSPSATNPDNPWAAPGVTLVPWLAPGEEVITLFMTLGVGSVSGTNDLMLVDQQITANATGIPQSLLTAWISGGIAGNTYLVTFSWLTNSTPVGRQDSRSMNILCVATL